MNLLVKYPTRERPNLFRETLALYLRDEAAYVLVGIDYDDPSMCNDDMLKWITSHDRVGVHIGESRGKVEAVNAGIDLAIRAYDILIVASDDMLPQQPDYAKRILDLFEQFHPDGDGVLQLDDGRVGKQLNTLPILGRPYFERFGYVYRSKRDFADGYISTHCDNEFHEVSEQLGRAVYVNEVVIRHEWIGHTHPQDKLHLRNESYFYQDERTFRRRKAAGFPA